HGHRVFAHRNGNTQGRTKLHTNRSHGFIEVLIFTWVPGGGHPVCRKTDIRELRDGGGGQVGNGFPYGHAARCRRINDSQRRSLTHGHCLTSPHIERCCSHRHISHRNLPGANHLVTGNQPGNRTIANSNQ